MIATCWMLHHDKLTMLPAEDDVQRQVETARNEQTKVPPLLNVSKTLRFCRLSHIMLIQDVLKSKSVLVAPVTNMSELG